MPLIFKPGRTALQVAWRRSLPLAALLLAGISPLQAQYGQPVTLAPLQKLGDSSPVSFAIGDLNRDGIVDVVGCQRIGAHRPAGVWLSRQDREYYQPWARLDSEVSGTSAVGSALADFNGDGNLDLVMCGADTGELAVYFGRGDGGFGGATTYPGIDTVGSGLAVADFDGNGTPDVALNTAAGIRIFYFTSGGAVSSTRDIGGSNLGIIEAIQVADFDGDGAPDLFFSGFAGSTPMILTQLRAPSPHLKLLNIPDLGQIYLARTVNLMGNGKASLAMADASHQRVVIVTDPMADSGTATGFPVGIGLVGLAFADLNRDGKLDLVAAHADGPYADSNGVLKVFQGGGGGTFSSTPVDFPLGKGAPMEMEVGDFDHDGGDDLVIGNPFGTGIRVYFNNSPAAPAFTAGGTSGSTSTGMFATFGFTASGYPAPTFSTTSPLPAGMSLNSNGTLSGTPAAGTAGTYPLVITASNGTLPDATRNFNLTIVSDIPSLTNLAPENIRSSSISIRGYLDGMGTSPVTRRGFVWSLTSTDATPRLGETGVSFVDVPVDTLQGFSAALTGLVPSSDYSYAAFAVNSSGTAYAPVSSFQTLASPGAGSLVVTTAVDEDNGNSDPNNGTGTSLREAVNYANLLGTNATITFSPNLLFSGPATLQVTLGQIILNNVGGTTTITGPGANLLAISGAANGMQRILRTVTGATVINGITFANGLSSNDGSALQAGGTVVLNDCAFLNNSSPLGRGGAVSVSGETRVYRSTFQGNSSGDGGAIVVEGNLLLVQCTLHGNSANRGNGTGDGGALYSSFSSNQIRVVHSTFTSNLAGGTGGAIFFSGSGLRVFNSIVSGNTAPASPNLQGSLQTNIGNLVDANAANIFATGLPASIGGPTPAIALKPGGLAINAGSNSQAVNWTGVSGQTADPLTTDQRGLPRTIGGTVDIGATELPGLPTVVSPVLSGLTSSSATLGGTVTSDGSGPISLRGIVFARTIDNPNPTRGTTGVTELTTSGTLGAFSLVASGLAPTTVYSFAAFAVNEAGVVYSSVGTFDTGTFDTDGDTLTDNQEAAFGSNRFLLDTDSDGFNDATEYLNGTNPASAASVPATTRVERVLGFGAARGLDLTGNFVYAFNVGPAGAAGQAGDATFTADTAPGITVYGPNNPIAVWNNPNFGSTVGDDTLEAVYQSIRWADHNAASPANKLRVDLANLVVGRKYKLQLLFGEAGSSGRRFDVLVNGALLVDNFAPTNAQGSAFMSTAGSAVVHQFTATSTTLNIVLDGTNVDSVANLNTDPYLNGATLELFPPTLADWRNIQGLASDGSQDLANPSGDGVANLLKFAFNMAPSAGALGIANTSVLTSNGTAGLPRITVNGSGRLVVTFVRLKAVNNPGLTYTVETSANLTAPWQTLDLTGATVTSIDASWERVSVTDPVVTATRFGRVRVRTTP